MAHNNDDTLERGEDLRGARPHSGSPARTTAGMRVQRASDPRTASLIALVIVTIALFSVLVPIHASLYGAPVPVAIPVGAGLCVAPLVALTRPRVAIVVFCLAAFALPLLATTDSVSAGPWPWPWSVPAMIAFTVFVLVITTVHGWRLGLVGWAVSMLGSLVTPMLIRVVPAGAAGPDLIVTASITGAALLVAMLLAGRIRVGEELTRERELTASEQARRVLVEERTRIARELHDVVAHSTSLIQVQASTARFRIPELPPVALAEFDDIAATARGSLTEMRRLLGVLRTDDHSPQLAPQQGIAEIPDLVEGIRRAGVEVEFSFTQPPVDLPPSLEIAAFRLTQEALSNAVRHAPGTEIMLIVGIADRSVTIQVHNDVPGEAPAPASSGGGHGLQGMQERVALQGGSLVVGPDPAGGWTVTAVLPWGGAAGWQQ
ncbi:sensor histidine kinase [Brachybacterium sp. FME24]|uniref:sensor histidine kinase n=1 Tax=Brachybacterium sp. FME24 TaxID=2742605 RepID=UPI001867F797|nr:sensor histidine kinase [Brachybacterium sp. FME24]